MVDTGVTADTGSGKPGHGAQGLKALVTGAAGFTGSAVVRELIRQGREVRAFVRSAATAPNDWGGPVEVFEGDIRSREDVLKAAEGVDTIYHIAALYRTAGHADSDYRDVNVGGVHNVLEAARTHGVRRTVHCSTIGVHGDVQEIPCTEDSPVNPGDIYQRTKLEGEQAARDAFRNGLPGVIVRPAGIYGPGDLRFLKLFKAIKTGRFWMIGSGETLLHLVYISDLVDGILLCAEHPDALGETYILAGPSYVSLWETTRLISEAVGTPLRRGRIPVKPVFAAARVCDVVCRAVGLEPPLHPRRVAFFTKNRAFSSEKAQREIGYQPKVSLAEGVNQTAQWYEQEGLL